jgi:hypothetical protein
LKITIATVAAGMILLGVSVVGAMPENDWSPDVFNICHLGVDPSNPPGNSEETLRTLIERQSSCQDEFLLSLETDVQSLVDEYGEQLNSVFPASEALLSLKGHVNSFQAVAASPEADLITLDAGFAAVSDAVVDLEGALNAVGDDAQLANVDLQNILQKQQQTLQMMSNISKMLHDTAAAVIRKIGG